MHIVPYFPLGDEALRQIIQLQLRRIGARVREHHRAEFSYDDAVVAAIAARCKEVESGARNVDHILTGTLLPEIAREVLGHMAEGRSLGRVNVAVDGGGKFAYQVS
jgi:type VI secretion system protein VasG